jgi:PST family polysaccharide transporter
MSASWIRFLPAAIRRRLVGRAQYQKILGNISWLSADRLIRMGVGLIVGVWVARYLGREFFGMLNFAAAFVALFSPLAALGLEPIVIRDLVGSPARRSQTLGTAIWLKLIGGIVAGVLAVGLILVTKPGEPLIQMMVVIASAGVLFQSTDVIDYWFQSQVAAKFVVYARTIAFLLTAVVRVVLILLEAPLVAFAWAACAELAVVAAGMALFYHREGGEIAAWRVSVARAKALLRDSWPLFFSVLFVAIYMKIDQVMLGYMLDDAAVGIYSVAIRLVEMWYFLPAAIAASVLPALIKAREEDESFYLRKLQTLYDVMGGLSLVFALAMSLLSTPIIAILYGHKFEGAGPILAVYAWAAVPTFLGIASAQHFVVEYRTRVTLYRTCAGAVASVAVNFVLIPVLGPLGAAFAFLTAQIVMVFSIVAIPGTGRQAGMLLAALNPLRAINLLKGKS